MSKGGFAKGKGKKGDFMKGGDFKGGKKGGDFKGAMETAPWGPEVLPVAEPFGGEEAPWQEYQEALPKADYLPVGAESAFVKPDEVYNEEPAPRKGKGKEPPAEKIEYDAPPRPEFLPMDATRVCLFEKYGWFVSDESCDIFGQAFKMAQMFGGGGGTKRPYENMVDPWSKGGKRKGKDGKDGKGGGVKIARTEEAVENPGLEEGEVVFHGKVKYPPNPETGYGFVADKNVAQLYGGKDAFLYLKFCPWVGAMNLKGGDDVDFNLSEDKHGNPQVKRVVRST
jgi:cold shock CspA family protein